MFEYYSSLHIHIAYCVSSYNSILRINNRVFLLVPLYGIVMLIYGMLSHNKSIYANPNDLTVISKILASTKSTAHISLSDVRAFQSSITF